METPDSLIATNLATLRKQRGHSVRALAALLADLGRPLAASEITKIENRQRRARVEDVIALAVALGVNPSRLLLPDRADEQLVALTPSTVVTAASAWRWADGDGPLDIEAAEDRPVLEADEDWQTHARPADLRARGRHTAARAAQDVAMHIDAMLRQPEPHPDWPEDGLRRRATRERPEALRSALRRLEAEVNYLLEVSDGRR